MSDYESDPESSFSSKTNGYKDVTESKGENHDKSLLSYLDEEKLNKELYGLDKKHSKHIKKRYRAIPILLGQTTKR